MTLSVITLIDEQTLLGHIYDPRTVRQHWRDSAACAVLPGMPYFPEEDDVPTVEALAHCASCPVAAQCLATALIHEATDEYRNGWWGGLSPDERDELWAHLGEPLSPDPREADIRDPRELTYHLRDRNHTVASIAAHLGCTERTIYRYLADRAA